MKRRHVKPMVVKAPEAWESPLTKWWDKPIPKDSSLRLDQTSNNNVKGR